MLVAFAGNRRSGKDTCTNYLHKFHGFKKKKFIKGGQIVVSYIYGLPHDFDWEVNKEVPCVFFNGKSRRQVLREVSEGLKSIAGQDLWIRVLSRKLDLKTDSVAISDLRFPLELDFVQQNQGIVFYLECEESQKPDDHVSESYQQLLKDQANYVITGDSVGYIRNKFVEVFEHNLAGVMPV